MAGEILKGGNLELSETELTQGYALIPKVANPHNGATI
jgi:hypothetical protein